MDEKPKKRRKRKPKAVNTHIDDQLEGALMNSIQSLKNYSSQGVMIIHSQEDKWKVIVYGDGESKDGFTDVMSSALNIGARALLEGPGNATTWTA